MRKSLLALVLVCTLGAPIAHAQSPEVIQQQIAALLAQISQLQALIQAVEGGSGAPTSSVPRAAECPLISRNLGLNSQGQDVRDLQQYLAADPTLYPEGTVSGFYGQLTARAVQRFQARVGIAVSGSPETNGYGAVGPRTRAALSNCEGLIQVNIPYPQTQAPQQPIYSQSSYQPTCATPPAQPPANACANIWEKVLENGCHTQWRCTPIPPMSITSSSGPAPLTATARFSIRAGDPYEISWGDGTANTFVGNFNELAPLSKSTVILPPANQQVSVPHTYNKQGTYSVGLRVGSYEEEGDEWVWRVRRYQGTVTVSGSNVTDAFEGVNISGAAPFTASFSAIINGAGSCTAGTYTLSFGNGTTQELTHGANECVPKTLSLTKTYTMAGTYTATLHKGTPAQVTNNTATQVGSTKVYVTGGGSASGAFTATVGTSSSQWNKVTVTFTLPTSDACSSYELDWGDGTAKARNDVTSTTPDCAPSVTSKAFSHTYPSGSSGTYTITLKRGVGPINNQPAETKSANLVKP